MPPRGPLGFLLFWIAALAAGTAFVFVVLGGGYGWLALAAIPVLVLLIGIFRARRKP